jgi:hypothetical protein
MKDLFIAAHEELIEQYLDAHPDATEDEAADATADAAYFHMTDKLASRADYLRDIRKGN